MIRLETTKPSPIVEQRVTRMMQDVVALRDLTKPEARAIYSHLEAVRDTLSAILDRVDGKHA